MDLYGQKSRSIPQKIVIILLELILLWLSYWILFQKGGAIILGWLGIHSIHALAARKTVVFIFSLVVFIRIGFAMFYLLKRKIPWEESFSIPMAFALYYVGFSLLVLQTDHRLDLLDLFGIALFLFGSFLNSYSEIQRHQWKTLTENKGKLFTGGLFRYSMHINYFGDVCWVTAYAILTRNWYSAIIPVFLLCFFIFFNIPKLDQYLGMKYGKSFFEFKKKTKKLIPFIY
ncbi:MAG: DUF1295 domain-containing protein [Bacteroidales bacterium]|nr:DUF1295 domain-containing protein [Bacteroidales bacterium]